ncbi:MAG: hypothetical protein K0R65_2436 [Crocinitomicaceae bacterium]|jgi:hypothetical protein|nr:hypothetical protein [Crocinitomicaceae bacterium]
MDFPVEQHLIPILQEENYRLMLQKQLLKDFTNSGLQLPSEIEHVTFSLTELFDLIREQIILQLEKGERQTLSLMYAVDIPEKTFLKILGEADFASVLTRLVIEREAQKIYFRVNFSK